MWMPQPVFLGFLAEEAMHFPRFRLVMGANVQHLVEHIGCVRGVRYRSADGWHEVRVPLTVGADGRFSRVRELAGFKPITTSSPVELLWFRLPRLPADPPPAGRLEAGHVRRLSTVHRHAARPGCGHESARAGATRFAARVGKTRQLS
jgi:2-polyprenyl-6-methoxyphenol hydroxylase-like FAD-dependent oxidoreductase